MFPTRDCGVHGTSLIARQAHLLDGLGKVFGHRGGGQMLVRHKESKAHTSLQAGCGHLLPHHMAKIDIV